MSSDATIRRLVRAMMQELGVRPLARPADPDQKHIHVVVTRSSVEAGAIPQTLALFKSFIDNLPEHGLIAEGYVPIFQRQTLNAGPLGEIETLAEAQVFLLPDSHPRAKQVQLEQANAHLLN